jgi:hypothetical protein
VSTDLSKQPAELRSEILRNLRGSPIFAFYVLATLLVAGVIGLMTFQPDLFPGMKGMNHFGQQSHRVHDLSYGFLFSVGVVGILAQLRHPARNVAAMVMALIPGASLVLAAALSGDAGVVTFNPLRSAAIMTVIVALLHPVGRSFFRSFMRARVDPAMLVTVIIAAVPLLIFAFENIDLQRTIANDHAAAGHYGFMAALAFTVIGTGILSSLRPDGWRLTAWVTAALAVLLGMTSLVYQNADSSLDQTWALAGIIWGIAFAATAARARTRGEAVTASVAASERHR